MDDDDRDSNASSDNEQDEVMEGADDVEPEPEPEPEPEDDDNEEEDGEEEDAEQEEGFEDNTTVASGPDGKATTGTNELNPAPRRASTPPRHDARWRPAVRPEAVRAKLYDIVPTMAAPQATSINAIAITPDLRYWMTGGSDGYIRKYDGAGTINGKQLLTVAQRHPFVDSVVKAGVLMSYWENEEPVQSSAKGVVDEHVLSPVYSLAVHSRALWLLAGTESGGINLQSVRHDEGKRITCLQRHSNAVSVLQLAPDERSVLSGSWDKNILSWDLNNGQVTRQFDGSGGQISAIELRPASGAPIPAEAAEEPAVQSDTFSSNYTQPMRNGLFTDAAETGHYDSSVNPAVDDNGAAQPAAANGETGAADAPGSEHESLFGSPAGSLFGEDTMGNNAFGGDDDNEFSQAMMALDSNPHDQSHGMDHADVSMMDAPDAAPSSFGHDPAPPSAPHPLDDGTTQPHEDQAQGLGAVGATHQPLADGDPNTINGNAADNGEASQSFDLEGGAAPPTQAGSSQQGPQQELAPGSPSLVFASDSSPAQSNQTQASESTFFSASIDGTIRVWDRRVPNPIARIGNRPGVPPWCQGATWSPDGNWIYAGRRNGTVEEYNIHKARSGWAPERSLKLPAGSGAVSAVRAMPNGRHLICASHDILRLYDLGDTGTSKHSSVPFLIVPGPPRAGVISCLYIDATARFMISAAGTRGWDGSNTEVLIGYEIGTVE